MFRLLASFVLAFQIALCPILCRAMSAVCCAVSSESLAEEGKDEGGCEFCQCKTAEENPDAPASPKSPCPCGNERHSCICSGAVFEATCHVPAPVDVSLDQLDLAADVSIGRDGIHAVSVVDDTDAGFAHDGRAARTLICSLLC